MCCRSDITKRTRHGTLKLYASKGIAPFPLVIGSQAIATRAFEQNSSASFILFSPPSDSLRSYYQPVRS